jgi:hypothetical protein
VQYICHQRLRADGSKDTQTSALSMRWGTDPLARATPTIHVSVSVRPRLSHLFLIFPRSLSQSSTVAPS